MRREAARKLFFRYDGSRFFMSRDGVEESYLAANIDPATERGWLAELTKRKLDALDKPGNWRIIRFLIHHGDFARLDLFSAVEPLGLWWERCAFLEQLTAYALDRHQRARPTLVRSTLSSIVDHANRLRGRARSEASRGRVDQLLQGLSTKHGRRSGAARR